LKSFISYFREEKKDLIALTDEQKITLAPHEQDVNKDVTLLSSKSYSITEREFDCLKGLSLSQTCKEIGKTLQISPRTVETYLQRIKDSVDVRSKQELLSLLTH